MLIYILFLNTELTGRKVRFVHTDLATVQREANYLACLYDDDGTVQIETWKDGHDCVSVETVVYKPVKAGHCQKLNYRKV